MEKIATLASIRIAVLGLVGALARYFGTVLPAPWEHASFDFLTEVVERLSLSWSGLRIRPRACSRAAGSANSPRDKTAAGPFSETSPLAGIKA